MNSKPPIPPAALRTDGTRALSRRLSCGVVIFNARRELLLCHVTGQRHWDLPKGGIDADESERDAALRETREETGLVLEASTLVDLGVHVYTRDKDLHLYAALIERVETGALRCTTHFVDPASGRERPEMDDFGWFRFDRIGAHCTANMTSLLQQKLGLDALFERMAPPSARLAA